ncbi:MAG: hypothetical protein J6X71_05410 [Bacteroidales bacterium]|nr:hypothetical protein [Bacteroidales bacterium]
MEVRLKVLTVPALDPDTREMHIAYTVLLPDYAAGRIPCVSGWTLKDAVDLFCEWFQVDRSSIKLIRPFLPQRVDGYDNQ